MSRESTIESFAGAIAQAMPPIDARKLDLILGTFRAMLAGRPAKVTAIAADAGWNPTEAAAQLRDWPGVYFDDDGRVAGFWGLATAPITTHLVTTEAGSCWAWCALDPLFILPLVNERGIVTARSGVTGTRIELVVTPDNVRQITAGGNEVYVSLLIPKGPFSSDVRQSFCDYVLFFDSKQSAERWTSEHPGTTELPLADAAAIGRRNAEILREQAASRAA